MSSDDLVSTWDTLLLKTRQKIDSFIVQDALAIDDREFKKAFESFSDGKVADTLVLQAFLSCGQLDYLGPKLKPQIWEVSSLLLERAFKADIEVNDLVKLMVDFNSCVPPMSDLTEWEMIKWGENPSLHKPLQDIFALYIEFYISVVHLLEIDFTEEGKHLANDPGIKTQMDQTSNQMKKALTEYQDAEYFATHDLRVEETKKGLRCLRKDPEDLPKERFEFIRFRGGGSYSEVQEVRQVQTGKVYIRKRMRKANDQGHGITEKQIKNECAIMDKLHHPHITSVQFWRHEGEDYFSLFMLPVADCDLWDYLHKTGEMGFPSDRVEKIYPWFGCLLHALDYAHGLNINHLDIKTGNILIHNAYPYLTDFGMAEDNSELEQGKSCRTDIGTPMYRAPEVQSSPAADIFSLGCVFSEMLTVTQAKKIKDFQTSRCNTQDSIVPPFKSCLPKVIEWIQQFTTKNTDGLADTIVKLVVRMLKEEPRSRPKAGEATEELRSNAKFWCESHREQ